MTKGEICKKLDYIISYCTALKNEIEHIEPEIQDGSPEHPFLRNDGTPYDNKPWKFKKY